MSAFDLDELRRLLAEATPGLAMMCHDNTVRIKSDKPMLQWDIVFDFSTRPELANEALMYAMMRNALPALLDGYEAGRKLREEMRAGENWATIAEACAEYDSAVGVE